VFAPSPIIPFYEAKMAKNRNRLQKILLFPKEQTLKTRRQKLPKFEPHDLRSVISEAKANEEVDTDHAFIFAFRRKNQEQIEGLLRNLGIDPSQPDAYRKGFNLLATYHYGVGHLAWFPRRTNKNAATWSSSVELTLLVEVMLLRKQGLSERRAVKTLVADPKKRQLFPYRGQRSDSTHKVLQKREDAVWRHLQKVKSSKFGASLLDLFSEPTRGGHSAIERALFDLDMSNSLPNRLVKNHDALQ
jgi:hypothetical protein